MSDLKTLNDLEMGHRLYAGCVEIDKLRQEAIKWIKYFSKPSLTPEQEFLDAGAINALQHFCNITEEDLK